MLHENEKTGNLDADGIWVDETTSAKLRNALSPFWTLSTILSNLETREKLLKTDDGKKLILDITQKCEESKNKILSLIDELSK